MAAPRISVMMSVFDDAPFVGAAIESVLAQGCGDFEFLIADDRSTDQSPAIVRACADRDPRIRLVEAPRKGRVPALNALLAAARGEFVAVLDSDDLCAPDRFERQLAFLDAQPEIGVLGGNAVLIDQEGRELDPAPLSRPLDHEGLLADAANGILLLHSTMMARTALVRAAGGYREPFRTSQDYDLYLRLAEVTRLANLPDVLAMYRVHPKQVSSARLVQQTLAAVVAWHSHEARAAGAPDPVEGLAEMPALDELDRLFGKPCVSAEARRRIVDRVLFSPEILAGDARAILRRHVRESSPRIELWRAAARLGRAGHFAPAIETVAGLMGARG